MDIDESDGEEVKLKDTKYLKAFNEGIDFACLQIEYVMYNHGCNN